MVGINQICNRVLASGKDIQGRWTWILLRGKGTLSCIVLTLYRAVKSSGDLSAYRQQQRVSENLDNDTCPRETILLELETLIQDWRLKGFQIVIMGDFNEDVTNRKLRDRFGHFGLVEIFLDKHGKPPNTYDRGIAPIDGIFASSSINILVRGYTATDWGMKSDHRLLWMDVKVNEIFGTLHPIWIPRAQKLKLVDPRIVQKF